AGEKKTVGMFIIEGIIDLFETCLTYITNTMSYLRIGGFVLSHAGLMLVFSIVAGMFDGVGSIIVLVIGNIFVTGFEGFIVSDWNSIQHTSGKDYYSQIVTAVNCGIDMLMEADTPGDVADILIRAVEDGDITTERLDDAARRIIQVKLDLGLFDDPYYEKLQTKVEDVGSDEYRALAREAVRKSLVLVKNNGILPLKKGMKLYITGPAADNKVAQCGGWTNGWNESPIEDMEGVTTLLGGFEEVADEYGVEIITDEDEAASADAVILAVGEKSYAEWNGDAKSIDLCGKLGLEGNMEAIKEAKSLNKPVVACVIAGRQVFVKKYIDDFDALIMCYLPGSEGGGIADMCFGTDDFTGRLPSPWYDSIKGIESKKPWLKKGFGLK
ncbi:MAG: glycoside hydrolase family 3 C-terminal domain-containing protein, partial [Eubacterium sp.]|nr:glycoside hydrolase family 3 C-terminal domain-containing protein [Eubacterium sp.]